MKSTSGCVNQTAFTPKAIGKRIIAGTRVKNNLYFGRTYIRGRKIPKIGNYINKC